MPAQIRPLSDRWVEGSFDVSGTSPLRLVAPFTGRIVGLKTVVDGAVDADAVLTVATPLGDLSPTQTIATSGAAAGDVDETDFPRGAGNPNAIVREGEQITVTSDGGPTSSVNAHALVIIAPI